MVKNKTFRKRNAVLASGSGIAYQICQLLIVFIYRTVFLTILSKQYLGINDLFKNVISLFSLSELGIGSCILYRLYKPIAENNIPKISAYLEFYKKAYRVLFFIVIGLGLLGYSFLDALVDIEQIPNEINVTAVYFLFVFQSAVSYLFNYRQSILIADQKEYIITFFNIIRDIVLYSMQICTLIVTHQYETVLMCGVILTVLYDGVVYYCIGRKYKEVFACRQQLEKEEVKRILQDVKGILCHKIGSAVVSSTDTIILSRFVNITAVGLYSNYSLIVSAVKNLLSKLLKSFIPTLGNYAVTENRESVYALYRKLLFVNMWLSSFCTICLYALLNFFIALWLDDSYLLSEFTVGVICVQFFLQSSSMVSNAFINGCGLFMKDQIRPLAESLLNLIFSVLLVEKIGISGVFAGTCISALLTYYWREPYLLYKKIFKISGSDYLKMYLPWLPITVILAMLFRYLCSYVAAFRWTGLIIGGIICGICLNVVFVLLFWRTNEWRYWVGQIKEIMKNCIEE